MKFSAVILAGGKSSRMGRDKAWLEVRGQSLLARQIQLVRDSGAREVFISGRAGMDYSEFGCRVLQDRLLEAGPLGGVARALEEVTTPLLLVLAVDMPRITAGLLQRLLLSCEECVGVVPRVGGNIEPLAAFYPKLSLNLINEMIPLSKLEGTGDGSLQTRKKLISASGFAKRCVERKLAKFVDVAESEANFFSNWNSPQDIK
jgi:molybdenum cofactor guanylyltransferase